MSALTPFVGASVRTWRVAQISNKVHATTYDLLADNGLRKLDYPVRTLCGRELYPSIIYGHEGWPKMVADLARFGPIRGQVDACINCAKRTVVES